MESGPDHACAFSLQFWKGPRLALQLCMTRVWSSGLEPHGGWVLPVGLGFGGRWGAHWAEDGSWGLAWAFLRGSPGPRVLGGLTQ